MLKSCPYCNDEAIDLLFNRINCTTHKCKNFDQKWEQMYLKQQEDYFVLCFCCDCILCNGKQKLLGKFRYDNIVYNVYYVYWDDGDAKHYMLLIHGDDPEDAVSTSLDYIEEYKDFLTKKYKFIIHGYELFHNELIEKAREYDDEDKVYS